MGGGEGMNMFIDRSWMATALCAME